MKVAVPVTKERNVTTFESYDSIDIFTFLDENPIKVESLPNLTSFSLSLFLVRNLAKKGVNAVLAKDMTEGMIASFLKKGIKVKLGCLKNGKVEAIDYIKELHQ